MMYGLVPVVIGRAAKWKSSMTGSTGRLWQPHGELVDQTHDLIENPKERATMAKAATTAARQFSKENFAKTVGAKSYGFVNETASTRPGRPV